MKKLWEAYEAYSRAQDRNDAAAHDKYKKIMDAALAEPDTKVLDVYFMGVFDTVSSIGYLLVSTHDPTWSHH